jgi:hypothetical protein
VPGARPLGSHQREEKGGEARPQFVVTLQPEPGVDPIRALRWVLKSALRKHGLKCVDLARHEGPTQSKEE